MVGRRRRASSVETINEVDLPYQPETTILKSLDESEIANSDYWPCFVLRDAFIYYRDSQGRAETHWMANLLHVNYDGPFIARGRLEVEDDDVKRLKHRGGNGSYITIEKVHAFSLQAEDEAGLATIWASGECGWYEIRPADKYLPIYTNMNDVARMYFELEAIYKESKKAPKRPLDDVLLSYATQVGTGITAEEAREMCKANAPFFLSHCRKEEAMHASDVQWSHTKFFRFLSQECKGILDILEQRESQSRRGHTNLPPTSRRPTPPPPAPKRKRSPLVESFLRRRPQPPGADSAAAAARRHGRAERIVPHIMDHEMADVDEPSLMPPSPEMAAEIEVEAVRRMLDVFEEIWHEHESSGRAMEKITKTTIHSRMFFKCSLDYQTPALITGYYSQSLLKSLPEKWEVTAFFEYLEEMAINPNRTLGKLPLHHVLKKLSRRKAQQHQQRVTATGASMSQETNTPSSVDGSRGRKKNRLAQASDVDPSEAMDVETPESQSMPRDTPQLRQPGRKRKTRPLDQDVKPAGKTPRLRLAARKRGLSDDEMEPLDFSRISRAAQETPIIYSDDSDDDSLPEPEIPIVIRTENIPSVIPRGPEGTWVCEEPGCKFIVRDADEASGKAEVDMHIESHGNNKEDEKERLLSYAVLEGNRNHLPVSHLLDKIRTFGQRTEQQSTDANGVTFPKPIRRALGW